MRVFISYPGKDGLKKAKQAGHKAWIPERCMTLGALVWEEISHRIVNKKEFLYICTGSSLKSKGQRFESEYAIQLSSGVRKLRSRISPF